MRLSHHSYDEIGAALGVNKQTACSIVNRVLKNRAKERAKDADKILDTEITRCEEVEKALWVNRGKPGHALALAAWTDRRHRLLGFKGEAPPPVDRTQLKQAIAEALGIEVEPRALPAAQRIVEVAAHGEDSPAEAARVQEEVHGRRVG